MFEPLDGERKCMLPEGGGSQKFWHEWVNGAWVNTGEECQPGSTKKAKKKAATKKVAKKKLVKAKKAKKTKKAKPTKKGK